MTAAAITGPTPNRPVRLALTAVSSFFLGLAHLPVDAAQQLIPWRHA